MENAIAVPEEKITFNKKEYSRSTLPSELNAKITELQNINKEYETALKNQDNAVKVSEQLKGISIYLNNKISADFTAYEQSQNIQSIDKK